MLEVLFAIGFALTGLLINKIGKFPILCKFLIGSLKFIGNLNLICFSFVAIVFILVGTGLCGISCVITNIPFLQIGFYIVMLTCGICSNIVNAACVEIYPTALRLKFNKCYSLKFEYDHIHWYIHSFRAMAVSISMMFGRLGSAFGANIVAYLLDSNCQCAFYMAGISLIGKISNKSI